MNERLPNHEQPSPLENVIFENDVEREHAAYLEEAAAGLPIYAIYKNGDARELSIVFKVGWADIARVGVEEEFIALYLKDTID